VSVLADLARRHTALSEDEILHAQRLSESWGLLADLCFADLLLFAPVAHPDDGLIEGKDPDVFVVLGQVRPTTSQTLYRGDEVGSVVDAGDRPLLARAFRRDEMIEGETASKLGERVRVQCIPVRRNGRLIAVMTRESPTTLGRQAGDLERVYIEVFNRFARMIALGEYPYDADDPATEEPPRVGDGAIVLDETARVEFISPNAVSALHRAGIHTNAEGMRLGEIGLDEGMVRDAFAKVIPVTEEVETAWGSVLVVRCLPLLERGSVAGAMVILRDISELRRRDRLLLSKDATIREIHHRVKNNLQTISALLRLQARRLTSPEAKEAVEESVRRIASIAVVHDILAREAGEDVPFLDILRPLLRTLEEGLLSPRKRVHFQVAGDAGKLPAAIATPLAVIITELLQNVVEHAYPEPAESPDGEDDDSVVTGEVVILLANDTRRLTVHVVDDGAGLPPGFTLDSSSGLGLSIVKTLVETELGGTIEMRESDRERGTEVELIVPIGSDWRGAADPTPVPGSIELPPDG
jgi:two-component sensor histidine kinase